MEAWHYDGEVALRRSVRIALDGATFRLIEGDRETGPFAVADLVPGEPSRGAATYGLKRHRGWRLGFPDGVPAEVAALLPRQSRYGGVIDRFGLWPATLAFAVVATIVVVLFLRTPALVARAVPASVEKRLGDVMVGDFGKNGCSTPAGDAALSALVQRIDPYDATLELYVVKLPIINAVTLPGGKIVLFDGLVQAARSPDEIAGVIGHEIGHVRHRDVLESLVRQLGLSVLLGGMEGHVGGYTNALLASSYSRDAEGRADSFAVELLRDAKISPRPTAAFFARLNGGRKGERAERMFAYVASHPVSADRAKRFAASAKPDMAYTPALTGDDWQALRMMCKASKRDDRWRF